MTSEEIKARLKDDISEAIDYEFRKMERYFDTSRLSRAEVVVQTRLELKDELRKAVEIWMLSERFTEEKG